MTFSFGDYDIDVERRELRRAKTPVHVEPQVFDLLVHLVKNRDRVVSKDDLIASVWGGRIVSDSTLTSRINAVRNAVGDTGEDKKLIRTIARKGFRFVGAVHMQPSGQASGQEAAKQAAMNRRISPFRRQMNPRNNRAWRCRCPTGPPSQYFPSST